MRLRIVAAGITLPTMLLPMQDMEFRFLPDMRAGANVSSNIGLGAARGNGQPQRPVFNNDCLYF